MAGHLSLLTLVEGNSEPNPRPSCDTDLGLRAASPCHPPHRGLTVRVHPAMPCSHAVLAFHKAHWAPSLGRPWALPWPRWPGVRVLASAAGMVHVPRLLICHLSKMSFGPFLVKSASLKAIPEGHIEWPQLNQKRRGSRNALVPWRLLRVLVPGFCA